MNYAEAEKLIFDQLPNFEKRGIADLKYNLDNIKALCRVIGNPHKNLKCIHVAGTNGKGSCSHLLASILQEQGYSVGLYTSPHLKNYRERFRINGQLIKEDQVCEFVNRIKASISTLNPTFFEVSVALAFYWFDKCGVDFAVIEVGLGGRLDSTNIITPVLSVITSIGLDHQKILGDTRAKIASEKAGIIKQAIPVVIGQRDEETEPVFTKIASQNLSPIFFTDDITATSISFANFQLSLSLSSTQGEYNLVSPLSGNYQVENLISVVRSIEILRTYCGFSVSNEALKNGVTNVVKNTGLLGRWQKIEKNPLVVCDTGHNEDAWRILGPQISDINIIGAKHVIVGFSNDKDVHSIIRYLDNGINVYFTEFNGNRSMRISEAKKLPIKFSDFFKDVNEALDTVKSLASPKDFIFIGGSTYVVAEIENL